MATSCLAIIAPVSIFSSIKNVVTPVLVSPLIIAQFIGAAPRYSGSREACRLNVPYSGISHTTFGNSRKATTTCRLACNERSSSRKVSSFKFVGGSTFKSCSKAYFFTADAISFLPRPAGLSGAVITPTIFLLASTIARSTPTAKSGVPINTILKFLAILFLRYIKLISNIDFYHSLVCQQTEGFHYFLFVQM